MFTTGSKWFLGLGLVSLVLAAAYGWTTGGTGLGPLTAGYNGSVGDHLGYTLLVSVALCAIFLGLISIAIRDAAPSALAELAGTATAPVEQAPANASYWPTVGAFGASLVVLGLVISNVLFVVGLLVLLAVLIEWMVLAWSDRATGDPEANRLVRDRLMGPFEVPLAGLLIAGGTVLALSRLLLTSSEMGATAVATVMAVAILGIGTLLATKPKLSPNVVASLLALCALGVVVAGVAAAARGERTIEHHDEAPGDEDGDLDPYIPAGTEQVTTTTVAPG
ncbi:MAG: hypothetical protein ABWZ76_08090 [Acidimicrobiales bacterium]